MGDKETVDLGILEDTPINIPRGQSKNLEANFKLDKKLEAPLAKGEVVKVLCVNSTPNCLTSALACMDDQTFDYATLNDSNPFFPPVQAAPSGTSTNQKGQ